MSSALGLSVQKSFPAGRPAKPRSPPLLWPILFRLPFHARCIRRPRPHPTAPSSGRGRKCSPTFFRRARVARVGPAQRISPAGR